MVEQGASAYSQKILAKQLAQCQQNEGLNASIGLENEHDLFLWNIIFEGPSDTLYDGGFFKAQLQFPQDYPNNPPKMKFLTKMWHPNIYDNPNPGEVCISILHPPGVDEMNANETADERWRPILTAESVILSVISMLNDPNIESPANLDASNQFRDNIKDYNRKVRRFSQDSVNQL